jgi:hypothetical protein
MKGLVQEIYKTSTGRNSIASDSLDAGLIIVESKLQLA